MSAPFGADIYICNRRILLPVTSLIVATLHRTELQTSILVEVIYTVIDEVDNILTILHCIKICLVRCTALYNRNLNV